MRGKRKGTPALHLVLPLSITCLTIAFALQYYIATVGITVKRAYYLHRTDLPNVTPPGKLMNTTKPPSGLAEITYTIDRGSSVYFYTPTLSSGSLESGTWRLHLWASTRSHGKSSRLTVEICLVSSDGSTTKATVGRAADVLIGYGYSEIVVNISGIGVSISSGDRIRLMLEAQTGRENDPKGIVFYYDGYGTYETPGHETRLYPP